MAVHLARECVWQDSLRNKILLGNTFTGAKFLTIQKVKESVGKTTHECLAIQKARDSVVKTVHGCSAIQMARFA
ncbi:hypothetical protein Y032_0447g1619 [Ancylostoma ceylanicum]|uniref:Uncharacterized protein n=1 Tax=Ancylostoma ceylanicum TaxID=53326 RepID=A0A016WYX5_9BILA|nr:hypothetical protein Y032_0447g1619 [Ancylostoma ceylanicum]